MSNHKKRVQSNRSKRNRKRKQRARSKKLYKRQHKSKSKQYDAQAIGKKVDRSQQDIKRYKRPMKKSFLKSHIKFLVLSSYIVDVIITYLITLIIHYRIPNLNYEIGRICGSIFTIILSSAWFSYWCYYINEQINNSNVKHAKAIKIVNNISNVYSSLTALFSYYMYTNGSDILPSMSNVLNKYVDPTLSIISVILLLIPSITYPILKLNKEKPH